MQVPELICYGRAKKEPDGYLDAVGGLRASFTLIGPPPKENSTDALAVGFTGIVPAVNALVAHWLSPLRPVLRQVRAVSCRAGQPQYPYPSPPSSTCQLRCGERLVLFLSLSVSLLYPPVVRASCGAPNPKQTSPPFPLSPPLIA